MSDFLTHGHAIYQIWKPYYILHLKSQASNFSSISPKKGFGTSQLERETVELY